MTHITVNANNFSNNTTHEFTVSAFLDYLTTKNINTTGHVVTEVVVDNERIELIENEPALDFKLSDIKSLEIKTKSSLELAFEAAESLTLYLKNIQEQIFQVIEFLRSGETDKGNISLAETIETIELFIQLYTGIENTLKRCLPTGYEKPAQAANIEVKLLEIVKELIEAKAANDETLLCDLLEYELVDNLNQWKLQVVPLLLEEQEKL